MLITTRPVIACVLAAFAATYVGAACVEGDRKVISPNYTVEYKCGKYRTGETHQGILSDIECAKLCEAKDKSVCSYHPPTKKCVVGREDGKEYDKEGVSYMAKVDPFENEDEDEDDPFENKDDPLRTCNNQGLQWAGYRNKHGDNDDFKYGQFLPENYKYDSPTAFGVTTTIGGINTQKGQQISIYGDTRKFSGDYFTLDHKGYLFASSTGIYKLTISDVDDAVFLWLGPTAQKGWTRNNADLILGYKEQNSMSIYMTSGQYMPIRIMFAQGQIHARFEMRLEGPEGKILDSATQKSPRIVRYSCDKKSAPKFSSWGQED